MDSALAVFARATTSRGDTKSLESLLLINSRTLTQTLLPEEDRHLVSVDSENPFPGKIPVIVLTEDNQEPFDRYLDILLKLTNVATCSRKAVAKYVLDFIKNSLSMFRYEISNEESLYLSANKLRLSASSFFLLSESRNNSAPAVQDVFEAFAGVFDPSVKGDKDIQEFLQQTDDDQEELFERLRGLSPLSATIIAMKRLGLRNVVKNGVCSQFILNSYGVCLEQAKRMMMSFIDEPKSGECSEPSRDTSVGESAESSSIGNTKDLEEDGLGVEASIFFVAAHQLVVILDVCAYELIHDKVIDFSGKHFCAPLQRRAARIFASGIAFMNKVGQAVRLESNDVVELMELDNSLRNLYLVPSRLTQDLLLKVSTKIRDTSIGWKDRISYALLFSELIHLVLSGDIPHEDKDTFVRGEVVRICSAILLSLEEEIIDSIQECIREVTYHYPDVGPVLVSVMWKTIIRLDSISCTRKRLLMSLTKIYSGGSALSDRLPLEPIHALKLLLSDSYHSFVFCLRFISIPFDPIVVKTLFAHMYANGDVGEYGELKSILSKHLESVGSNSTSTFPPLTGASKIATATRRPVGSEVFRELDSICMSLIRILSVEPGSSIVEHYVLRNHDAPLASEQGKATVEESLDLSDVEECDDDGALDTSELSLEVPFFIYEDFRKYSNTDSYFDKLRCLLAGKKVEFYAKRVVDCYSVSSDVLERPKSGGETSPDVGQRTSYRSRGTASEILAGGTSSRASFRETSSYERGQRGKPRAGSGGALGQGITGLSSVSASGFGIYPDPNIKGRHPVPISGSLINEEATNKCAKVIALLIVLSQRTDKNLGFLGTSVKQIYVGIQSNIFHVKLTSIKILMNIYRLMRRYGIPEGPLFAVMESGIGTVTTMARFCKDLEPVMVDVISGYNRFITEMKAGAQNFLSATDRDFILTLKKLDSPDIVTVAKTLSRFRSVIVPNNFGDPTVYMIMKSSESVIMKSVESFYILNKNISFKQNIYLTFLKVFRQTVNPTRSLQANEFFQLTDTLMDIFHFCNSTIVTPVNFYTSLFVSAYSMDVIDPLDVFNKIVNSYLKENLELSVGCSRTKLLCNFAFFLFSLISPFNAVSSMANLAKETGNPVSEVVSSFITKYGRSVDAMLFKLNDLCCNTHQQGNPSFEVFHSFMDTCCSYMRAYNDAKKVRNLDRSDGPTRDYQEDKCGVLETQLDEVTELFVSKLQTFVFHGSQENRQQGQYGGFFNLLGTPYAIESIVGLLLSNPQAKHMVFNSIAYLHSTNVSIFNESQAVQQSRGIALFSISDFFVLSECIHTIRDSGVAAALVPILSETASIIRTKFLGRGVVGLMGSSTLVLVLNPEEADNVFPKEQPCCDRYTDASLFEPLTANELSAQNQQGFVDNEVQQSGTLNTADSKQPSTILERPKAVDLFVLLGKIRSLHTEIVTLGKFLEESTNEEQIQQDKAIVANLSPLANMYMEKGLDTRRRLRANQELKRASHSRIDLAKETQNKNSSIRLPHGVDRDVAVRLPPDLMPHQLSGVSFLYNLWKADSGGAILADDTGTGKTATVLAYLQLIINEQRGPAKRLVSPTQVVPPTTNQPTAAPVVPESPIGNVHEGNEKDKRRSSHSQTPSTGETPRPRMKTRSMSKAHASAGEDTDELSKLDLSLILKPHRKPRRKTSPQQVSQSPSPQALPPPPPPQAPQVQPEQVEPPPQPQQNNNNNSPQRDTATTDQPLSLSTILESKLEPQTQSHPNLIICPQNVFSFWIQEARHYAPDVSIEELPTDLFALAQSLMAGDPHPDVYIVSYNTLIDVTAKNNAYKAQDPESQLINSNGFESGKVTPQPSRPTIEQASDAIGGINGVQHKMSIAQQFQHSKQKGGKAAPLLSPKCIQFYQLLFDNIIIDESHFLQGAPKLKDALNGIPMKLNILHGPNSGPTSSSPSDILSVTVKSLSISCINRILVTGTPIYDSPADLVGTMEFILPDYVRFIAEEILLLSSFGTKAAGRRPNEFPMEGSGKSAVASLSNLLTKSTEVVSLNIANMGADTTSLNISNIRNRMAVDKTAIECMRGILDMIMIRRQLKDTFDIQNMLGQAGFSGISHVIVPVACPMSRVQNEIYARIIDGSGSDDMVDQHYVKLCRKGKGHDQGTKTSATKNGAPVEDKFTELQNVFWKQRGFTRLKKCKHELLAICTHPCLADIGLSCRRAIYDYYASENDTRPNAERGCILKDPAHYIGTMEFGDEESAEAMARRIEDEEIADRLLSLQQKRFRASGKLIKLKELLGQLGLMMPRGSACGGQHPTNQGEDHRCVIFAKSCYFLQLIATDLLEPYGTNYRELSYRTSSEKREEIMRIFGGREEDLRRRLPVFGEIGSGQGLGSKVGDALAARQGKGPRDSVDEAADCGTLNTQKDTTCVGWKKRFLKHDGMRSPSPKSRRSPAYSPSEAMKIGYGGEQDTEEANRVGGINTAHDENKPGRLGNESTANKEDVPSFMSLCERAENAPKILLTTYSVAGYGVTLTGADTVILIEHTGKAGDYLQSIGRAIRLTQKRNVTIYDMSTVGTIEAQLHTALHYKIHLSKDILNDKT